MSSRGQPRATRFLIPQREPKQSNHCCQLDLHFYSECRTSPKPADYSRFLRAFLHQIFVLLRNAAFTTTLCTREQIVRIGDVLESHRIAADVWVVPLGQIQIGALDALAIGAATEI